MAVTNTSRDKNYHSYIVPGLKRGIDMLRLFSHKRPSMRLSELAAELGVSRSSAFRLAYTLENLGLIERNQKDQHFHLASGVLKLGFEYLNSLDIVEVAQVPIETLRDRSGLSTHLAILEGVEIVHLLRSLSRHGFVSNVAIGSRRPAYATPMGRVLLSEMLRGDIAELFAEVKFQKFSDQTPRTLKQLDKILAADRERGYVLSHGSFIPGGSSIAAPVRDSTDSIVAAINVSGPTENFNVSLGNEKLIQEVCGTALEISARLGYVPRPGPA